MDVLARGIVERRRSNRSEHCAEHGILWARVRPGYDAVVLNVSERGLLIETTHRLLPGSRVELHLKRYEGRATLAGRVLHASVSSVAAAGIRYRSAVVLDRELPWAQAPVGLRPADPVHGRRS